MLWNSDRRSQDHAKIFAFDYRNPIRIGNKCWIGANAIVLPGVSLGDHVIVGAGAIVTKSFPSNCTIAGVPARIIKDNVSKAEGFCQSLEPKCPE